MIWQTTYQVLMVKKNGKHNSERARTYSSNLTLNAKNSLISRRSHVENSIIQTSILVNPNKLFSSLHQ